MNKYLQFICILLSPTISLAEPLIAFPGVEGHGKYTVGGRGGAVYAVTNLNDSGEGSLRAAVEAKGARTVVFRVSGTITLESSLKISNPNINMVANYYKPGPATAPGNLRQTIASPSTRDGLADLGRWFIADNVVEGNDQVTADNWDGGVSARGGSEAIAALKLHKPWPAMAIEQQTAQEAYEAVLENVGATLPKRDSVDARIIQEVRDGTATSRLLGLALLGITIATSFAEDQLAFPTAEGYGKYSVGGRGGKVIEVTNLNESGEGSFRAAVEAEGPRTVVFRVSGTIDTDLKISNDKITIAGQTAPGDGITLKGKLEIRANHVIIRYIRVRAEARGDAVSGRYQEHIILDHMSASWSSDEVLTLYHGKNVTIQWCMITEACSGSHKFGGIWGNSPSTYHHNLFAHNIARNPRFASGSGYNDFRNNVIYNWQHESVYGGEKQQPTRATSAHEKNKTFSSFSANLVANYFKPGPGTLAEHRAKICAPWSRKGADDYGDWYVADNHVVGSPEVTADNWKGIIPQYTKHLPIDLEAIPGLKLDKPSKFMPINQQTAEEAYQAVLAKVGCSLPKRDAIDTRIIEEVRNGTAQYGDNGFIASPSLVGGWPELKSGTAPADADHDGMPDAWEATKGLDPKDPSDRNTKAAALLVLVCLIEPDSFAPVQTVSAQEAYPLVLADVGATLPKRDSVDLRVIEEVRTSKNTFGNGVVVDPEDVGGWPELVSTVAPVDSDRDGMPDAWEKGHGLPPMLPMARRIGMAMATPMWRNF